MADLSKVEEKMRTALLRESKKQHAPVAPDRADIIKKTWIVTVARGFATLLEGRLERNVMSGDINISFRKFTVPLPPKENKP